ncbi:helix-turn-helix domain-containing protein [Tautonia plasticadhaerens]|uniref:MarR family protein n=1 Tax=Tautonia plasticadhaerens TaxID=2527974 RepID=A0A518H827_9BACT|nr:hypothetical protein [Tautonia plasticadhaerens]QDV36916.1 MarR family protein [Tautonia plasticadhaerens]
MLYDEWWAGKRYIRMLTCTKTCPLSHHQRLVSSRLVYKMRDGKPVLRGDLADALGLDPQTVSAATKSLVAHGLAARSGRGHVAVEPMGETASWFGRRHEGERWWECLPTYRLYPLTEQARRTRWNRGGHLTEMDNAVLWLLYSLGKGTPEVVGQANRGLKALLGCSLDTLKAAIRRLAGNGLVMARSDGFTLLAPTAEASAWWQDRKRKGTSQTQQEKHREAEEESAIDFAALVCRAYPADSRENWDFLADILGKKADVMLAGRFTRREVREYWAGVLPMLTDADRAFNFVALAWEAHWNEAVQVHGGKGVHDSCFHLLKKVTGQRLAASQRPVLIDQQ